MSDSAQGPGWWLASDGRWYPPELWTGPTAVANAPSYGPSAYPTQVPSALVSTRRGTNGLAVASLVCSCAGIVLLGVPSIVGIVLGFVARAKIRQSNGEERGDGLALAGIIVGLVVVGLVLLVIVVNATHGRTGH
jgi:Domain of unknown function (DUF4190)